MASALPALSSFDNLDNYECIGGQLIKKQSVGRKQHSQLERIVRHLLNPPSQQSWAALSNTNGPFSMGKTG